MKKWVVSMMVLVLALALVLTGCAPAAPAVESPETDFLGRELPQVKDAQRIVSLTASNTEILFALGLGDKVVGVDAFSDYPAEVLDIEKVGDYSGPNAEAVVALEPDLVLAGNKIQKDSVAQLEGLGLTVVAAEASAYDEVFDAILMVGKVTGKEKEAAELVTSLMAREDAVMEAVKDLDSPKVYYAISYGEAGNWTSGPGSFINTMIEMAGGICVTNEGIDGQTAEWMQYSNEALVEQDPGIVLISSFAGGVEGLASAAGFQELEAVQQGFVVEIDAGVAERPGPRIIEGLEAIAKALHPDAFQ